MITSNYVPFSTDAVSASVVVPEVSVKDFEFDKSYINADADLIGCHTAMLTTLCDIRGLDINVSTIREIRLGAYLMVDKDVLWVTPDVWEQLNIMSDLDWTIN